MNIDVIIPAAGKGSRMKAKQHKQFILLNGVPIIIHTLWLFEFIDSINKIVLAVSKDHIDFMISLISKYNITKVSNIVVGGTERQDSVFNALSKNLFFSRYYS